MQQKNAKICVIQLNENNGNGNASVVFFCFFSSGVAVLFSTTFCAEMQCRFFFAVFINFQCFVCAVIFHRVFCLLVVQLFMRFCFFRKNFQYAVARCVGYFSTTFCTEMQCRCLCRFHQFSMFCLSRNLSPCNFCLLVVQLLLRFCFSRKFCVFVCKLSGRLSEKVPRLGSLLVSTVFLV